MSKLFTPNRNGVVIVVMASTYGSNVAGETAGFLPAIAKELIKKGYAELPGQPSKPEQPADGGNGAELTTRKFNPQKQPDDVVPGSATDKLRAEYKELTGSDADARWGAARLAAEIDKALEAATEPEDGAEQPADGGEQANAAE